MSQEPESDRYLSDASTTQAWREMVQRDMAEQRVKLDGVVKRVDEQAEQIDSIRGELMENSKVTQEVKNDTEAIREATKIFRYLSNAGDWVIRKTKPIIGWAAAVAALYFAIRNGLTK